MRSVHSVVKWIEHRSPNHSNRFDYRLHRYEPDKKTDQLGGARFVVPGLRIGILTTEFTECTEWVGSSNRSFRAVLSADLQIAQIPDEVGFGFVYSIRFSSVKSVVKTACGLDSVRSVHSVVKWIAPRTFEPV